MRAEERIFLFCLLRSAPLPLCPSAPLPLCMLCYDVGL